MSPSVLNHLTVGFNRVYTASKAPSVNGSDWEKVLGIAGASGPTFPQISIEWRTVRHLLQPCGATTNYSTQIPNALVVADSVSWDKGRHSLRTGLRLAVVPVFPGEPRLIHPLPTLFRTTKLPLLLPAKTRTRLYTGDPFASFLLGLPDQEGSASVLTFFALGSELLRDVCAG